MKYQPVIFTVNYVFLLFPMHCYHSNIFFEGEMKIHSGLVSMYQKIDKLYNKHMLACSNDSQRACIYNVTAETLNPSSYSPCNVPTSDKVRTTVRTAVKRQKCETLVQVDQRCLQRTNICSVTQHSGQTSTHAQMDNFLPAARHFPAQNFKGKHWKQPV